MMAVLGRLFPVIRELRLRGGPEALRDDVQAGLTLAFLAIPQCMAYAVIANLHPIYGLYAAIVTAVVASLFVTSRHLVTGPTATVSIIVAGILYGVDLPPATAVIYLSLLVGVLQVLFYFLQVGNLARFVSDAVIAGFVMGSALVIIGGQLLTLLGAPESRSAYFFVRLYSGLRALASDPTIIPMNSLVLGGGTVALLLVLRWVDRRLPASLILLLLGSLAAWWFQFEQYGISVVGELPSSLPRLTLPSVLDLQAVEQLFAGALALALFCVVQDVSIAKSIANRTRDTINENRVLLGQGFANVAAGLFSGYPVAASFSRSFLNQTIGGVTQLSALLSGVFVAVLTAAGASLIYFVPLPVLTGIIIVVVAEVVEVEEVLSAWRTTMQDRIAFLTTFLGVIFLQLDFAIYMGVAVSLILYLREATRLDLKEYIVDDEGNLKHITSAGERMEPRVAVIDVNGEAFFGAADQIQQRVRELCEESKELRVIILRMKNAANFDVTGATVLRSIAEELRDRGKTLMLCGTTPQIREVLKQASVSDVIGEDKILVAQKNLLESTKSALERAQDHIDEVLEGELEREEEDPSLEHTMEDLADDIEEEEEQDPIEQEKHTADEPDPQDWP